MNINKQEYFAFYGTLRQNQGNWRHFLDNKEGVEYLGTEVVQGYEMFSLGGYPMISVGKGSIVVDLFKITNQSIKGGIDGMELGAGYDRKIANINGVDYLIYTNNERYYSYEQLSTSNRAVESGDWVSYRNQPKPVNASV